MSSIIPISKNLKSDFEKEYAEKMVAELKSSMCTNTEEMVKSIGTFLCSTSISEIEEYLPSVIISLSTLAGYLASCGRTDSQLSETCQRVLLCTNRNTPRKTSSTGMLELAKRLIPNIRVLGDPTSKNTTDSSCH